MLPGSDVLLDAVTVTKVSQPIRADGMELFSLQLIAAAVTSGNGVFKVEISNEETASNWVQYNKLVDNVINAITEAEVRVADKTLSSNTSAFMFFDSSFHARWLRVTCTVTTDGEYTAIIHRRQTMVE